MRIKIINSRMLFDEILRERKISLKQFSRIIKENYSNLKKYRRGDLSIPEALFSKLLNSSPKGSFWSNQAKKLEDNWGARLGGEKSGNKRNMAYVRKFRKIIKPHIKINEFFCEFYGALLGDGCVSHYIEREKKDRLKTCISGNKELDSQYLEYLKKRLECEFNVKSYFYRYKNRNLCNLIISSKRFSEFLNKFGFPVGLKYGKIKIPRRLMKLPWRMKKLIIRGLFDTDGSICAKKREKYRYPQISIASKDKVMLKQVYSILREQKYPCWLSGKNLSIRGKETAIKWFKDIGSSNNRNIFKYEYWLKNKVLPPKLGPMV